ncbi:MAG TPA: Gfo/Idh/MocA family oxidoreductase [Verrucomicrobiales bacterium]|nr:Gfo/Idh/MocA family oxidoreductase [Verrucomicrobiales bacterium]
MTRPLDRRAFLGHSLAGVAAASPALSALAADAPAKPLRLGLVSAASYGASYGPDPQPRTPGSNHGTAFATVFNGFDEEKAKGFKGTFVRAGRRLEGAKVVKIWDPDKAAAGAIAEICGIETVAETPDQCVEGVDAALLIDDGSGAQWKYAEAALRKGIPTFCDKPLAMTAKEAAAIAKIARETGTKFMSASSLRFVPDIVKLREDAAAIGPVRLCTVTGPGDLVYYGIHALSMAYAILGAGVVSAHNTGREGGHIVRLRHEKDLDIVLMVGARERMRAGFSIQLFGEKGTLRVEPDLKDLYAYLLEAFLDLVLRDKVSVPVEEEVELIASLEAGQRSLEMGREVKLSEVM